MPGFAAQLKQIQEGQANMFAVGKFSKTAIVIFSALTLLAGLYAMAVFPRLWLRPPNIKVTTRLQEISRRTAVIKITVTNQDKQPIRYWMSIIGNGPSSRAFEITALTRNCKRKAISKYPLTPATDCSVDTIFAYSENNDMLGSGWTRELAPGDNLESDVELYNLPSGKSTVTVSYRDVASEPMEISVP